MEVKLSIEDNQFDFFMKFLDKLPKGIINKYEIIEKFDENGLEYVSHEEQKEIEKILKNRSKEDLEIASKEIVNIDF